jgi:UDP-glucuronate decarboxylase
MNTPDDSTGPVNTDNPREFMMIELVESVQELTDSKSRLIFQPAPVDHPRQ